MGAFPIGSNDPPRWNNPGNHGVQNSIERLQAKSPKEAIIEQNSRALPQEEQGRALQEKGAR